MWRTMANRWAIMLGTVRAAVRWPRARRGSAGLSGTGHKTPVLSRKKTIYLYLTIDPAERAVGGLPLRWVLSEC